jgi:uncharacterized SAM-binding protein YcdF (DUF218 family)
MQPAPGKPSCTTVRKGFLTSRRLRAAGFIMKKFFFICAIAALLISAAVSQRTFLLTRYALFFTVNSGTRGADALVVLAGGILTRLPRAIELCQQGYAPRIILTNPRQQYPALRHVCGDEWLIAPAIIEELHAAVTPVYLQSLKPGGVTSTFDEAYDLRDYSLKNHFHHLIIVTDNHHTRRALYAFQKVFNGTGIRVEARGAGNNIFNESNWWQCDTGISVYLLEGVKYAVYPFTDRNVPFIKNY